MRLDIRHLRSAGRDAWAILDNEEGHAQSVIQSGFTRHHAWARRRLKCIEQLRRELEGHTDGIVLNALAVRLGFAKPTQATKKAKGGALPRG